MNQCDFLLEIKPGLWETTRILSFRTRYGEVTIPAGFRTNLFTAVPNTEYPLFWLASILHDYVRGQVADNVPGRVIDTRRQCDVVFYDEMLVQTAKIFGALQEYVGTERAVMEFRRLLHLSWIYYKGVAGVIGTVYWWWVR